jgi:Fe-S-cluster-containing dehydrogenase component
MSEINRRDFLKLVGVGAVAAVGMQIVNKAGASGPVAKGEHQWAMVIDQAKCKGCDYCIQACRAHNDIDPDNTWNPVFEDGEVNGEPVFLSRPCMQCEKAPCVEVCPVGASTYRSDGIVMMDYDKCIGCRYCVVACPYGARVFNWKDFEGENPSVPQWGQPEVPRRPRGVPEKCAFCYQRIDRGMSLGLTPGVDPEATPACIEVCPTGARTFGDLNDPHSAVSQLLATHPSYRLRVDLGTGPRVYYLPAEEVSS